MATRRKTPFAERFWRHVERTDSCWLWVAHVDKYGYGTFKSDPARGRSRTALVHRLAYELAVGPIPDGMQIDHLCRVRNCVNPAHLEAVTQYENIARGEASSARAMRQTHCIRGHELPPKIHRVRRECAECRRVRRRSRLEPAGP